MSHARGAWALVAGGLLAMASGCAHAPPAVSPEVMSRLSGTPGGYLTGSTNGLGEESVLNRKDFIWGLAFSEDARRVAYTRLGLKAYNVSVWEVGPPVKPLADPDVNSQEFDVEGVALSPDGALVATASRSGAVRLFDAVTGEAKGSLLTEEPLGAVAFHPNGKWLAVGSAKGLVTVLAVQGLTFASEARGHAGPVSALAFAADGTLYSGSWDKHVRAWSSTETATRPDQARTRFDRRGGFTVLRGLVNGKASLAFALDSRAPSVLLTSEAATAAGIDVPFLKETVNVPGALGNTVARLARAQSLRFKSLVLDGVDVAVCDSCVPQGSQGVLGAPFSERVEVAFDDATQEAVFTLKGAASRGATAEVSLALEPRRDFTFPAYVSDVTVDAKGARLGVALSEQKPERNRDVYDRERKKVEEPQGPFNTGALVDAMTGQVLHKWPRHHGVVATAAISPDGRSLLSGGWDKRVFLFTEGEDVPRAEVEFGWSVRRARFSPDGRWVGVAAWTPQKATGSQESDPAAVLLDVRYASPQVERREARAQ